MRSLCLVELTCPVSSSFHGVDQGFAGRDQDAGGHGVVFGLADQIGGDERRVGRVVGDDRNLGGAGLRVDGDTAADVALGGGDIDVARSGDQVDRRGDSRSRTPASRWPVRRRRHRPRRCPAARMRPGSSGAAVPPNSFCGGRRQRDGRDTGHLRRDSVHDDGADQRCESARDVQADALHRHHPAFDDCPGADVVTDCPRARPRRSRGAVGWTPPGGANVRIERVQRRRDRGERHPQRGGAHAVEALAEVQNSGIGTTVT